MLRCQRILDRLDQRIGVYGLPEDRSDQSFTLNARDSEACQIDDGQSGLAHAGHPRQRHAVDPARHDKISEEQINRVTTFKPLQGVVEMPCDSDLVARIAQNSADRLGEGDIIIHNQNMFGHSTWLSRCSVQKSFEDDTLIEQLMRG